MEKTEMEKFIQGNSPDSGFLQSEEWRKFQEAVGRKTYYIESLGGGASKWGFKANVIEHQLPVVGKYFYIPRGPIIENPKSEIPASPARLAAKRAGGLNPKQIQNLPAGRQGSKSEIQNFFNEIVGLAKKENAGWIRIDPKSNNILETIKECFRQRRTGLKIQKAPHDMQPREILMMDITKSEEELLAEMKQKTRYNIKVAQKRGVSLRITNLYETTKKRDIDEFIRLVKITARRDGITPHPKSYYRQMFETIPGDILKLYVAEYEGPASTRPPRLGEAGGNATPASNSNRGESTRDGKIIAANIVIHYNDTAIYLHGALDNEYRNVMAPYLLQWQAIKDAKAAGLTRYDLGGVKTLNPKSEILNPKQIPNSKPQIQNSASNSWQGITRFKTGFSPNTEPKAFPGSYDIIINPFKYYLYRALQKIKNVI